MNRGLATMALLSVITLFAACASGPPSTHQIAVLPPAAVPPPPPVLPAPPAAAAVSPAAVPAQSPVASPSMPPDAAGKAKDGAKDPADSSQGKIAGGKKQEAATTKEYVKLTNFLVINPTASDPADRKGKIAGTYTRLMVRGNLESNAKPDATGELAAPEGGRPMKYEPRYWITRAIWGKETATNFSLTFKIETHEQVASLVTIGWQSNTNGEKWERVISHSDYSFPYFLVRNDGSSSVPKLTFKLKSDNTYQSRGLAAALSVALQVADKLVREPTVVNTLASQASREKAQAADAAISQLFGTSIVEQLTTERDLAPTRNSHPFALGDAGVEVRLLLPVEEGDYRAEPKPVGSWYVGFDDPKPSIFSPVRICAPASTAGSEYCAEDVIKGEQRVASGLRASEVLAFLLTPPPGAAITVEAYLRSRPYVQSSILLFESTDAAIKLRAYDTLCQNVVNDIVKLGLNDFDGRIVLWALAKGMPDVVSMSAIPANSICKLMLVGLPF